MPRKNGRGRTPSLRTIGLSILIVFQVLPFREAR